MTGIGYGGFSLLEMLICLSLMAVLSTFAFSVGREPDASSEAMRFSATVAQLLSTARGLAVASGERITVCGSADGDRCRRDWQAGVEVLVFTDRNGDGRLNLGDSLHLRQRITLRYASVRWRGSGGRFFQRFRVDGGAIEFGRYSYCPLDNDPLRYRSLVVNRAGRAYRQANVRDHSRFCK